MTNPLAVLSRPVIAPSLLAADFGALAHDIRAAEEAGVEVFHLDIMDGHFVPNLSFGIPVVEAIRRSTDRLLDVHLMLSEPGRYLDAFRRAGADAITVHIEVLDNPRQTLSAIRKLGCAAGLSLNPPTLVDSLLPFVNECDLVLVMSVMPGFGGQSFDRVALKKLTAISSVAHPTLVLSVDGGMSPETIPLCADARATMFVVGTAFFSANANNYSARLTELKNAAQIVH